MKQKMYKSILITLLLSFGMSMSAGEVYFKETTHGSISYTINGTTVTLIVEPDDDYFITADDILVEKAVDGGVVAQAPRRGPDISAPIEVTAVDVDDRGKGTYSFTLAEGYDAYVTATFKSCISIYPSIEMDKYEWTYGETPFTITVTGNYGNANVTYYYYDDNTGNCSTDMPTDAGNYQVYAWVEAKGHYCAGGTAFYSFYIYKVPLTITAKSYTIQQGDELPDFEAEYEGFVNGETSDVLTTPPTLSSYAASDSSPGDYVIYAYGAEAQNYDISYVNGKLTITSPAVTIGDVNGDGMVDVADGVEIVNYILNNSSADFNTAAADVDGDGQITIADAVGVMNIILNK